MTAFSFGVLIHTQRHTSSDGVIQTVSFLGRSLIISNVQYKTLHVELSVNTEIQIFCGVYKAAKMFKIL